MSEITDTNPPRSGLSFDLNICKLPTDPGQPDEYRAADYGRMLSSPGTTPGEAAKTLIDHIWKESHASPR